MKKLIPFILIAGLITLITLGAPSGGLLTTNDEDLGPSSIQIASGSGMVTAGVGLLTQPGNLSVTVPNHTIKQVLLYWQGSVKKGSKLDDSIILQKQGGSPVSITGIKIGDICLNDAACPEPAGWFSGTMRADITSLNLVSSGLNNFTVSGLSFDHASNGAGIVVIYDDGTGGGSIGVLDGHDFAYHKFSGILKTVNPKTLSFPASSKIRSATLHYFISSVEGSFSGGGVRPNSIEVTIDGNTTKCSDCLNSHEGQEWDSLDIPIVIPAGVTSVSTQIFSRDDLNRTQLDPASLVWNFLAISIEDDLTEACAPGDSNKLIRGIDIAGVAGQVDGAEWDNGSVNFSHSGTSFINNSVALSPLISDLGIESMIRSSIFHGFKNNKDLYMTINGIHPEKYDLYLWSWEDNSTDNFSLSIEGTNALQNQATGSAGQWTKHGPFTREILDGSINITASGGDANISGIEIRCAVENDCSGTPGGSAIIDDCGVCDGANKDKGCDNICFSGKTIDACGDCGGTETNPNKCTPDCNGIMGGTAVIDDCGVCDGANKDKGCDNICFSGKTVDACNNCGGTETNPNKCTPDCKGVMGGTAVIDDCGVCDGKNEAKGCDNVCFSGKTTDDCKVCGGTNSDKGCDNVCFSNKELDACDICGGTATDASQCITIENCKMVDPTPEILDFAKRFQKLSKGLFKRIMEDAKRDAKYSCGAESAKIIAKAKALIAILNEASLSIFANGIKVCDDSCVTLSFAEEVRAQQKTLNKLSKLAIKLANRVKDCYDQKQVQREQPGGYVTNVVSQSKEELNSLIKDCSNTEVCAKKK